MRLPIKLIFILLWLLSACVPSPLATNDVSQANLPTVISKLESKQDYVIYVKEKQDGLNEVWAIDPETSNRVLVAKGNRLYPKDWSPSGDYWLFADYYSIYMANANGSDVRRVYEVKEKSLIAAWWLSDSIILFDVYAFDANDKIWPPPHNFSININTGETSQLDPKIGNDVGGTYLIQGINQTNKSWIQVNGFTNEVEIADFEGNRTEILIGYNLRYPIASLSIDFVPKTEDLIFFASRENADNSENGQTGLWKMPLSDGDPELIAEEESDIQFYDYHVSPNGEYLAYTYLKDLNHILAIYDLHDQKVEYEWDFPYQLSSPRFIWSPDSRYIALPYSTYDYGTSNATSYGIQIMDISYGVTKLLVDEDVAIAGWYRIGY